MEIRRSGALKIEQRVLTVSGIPLEFRLKKKIMN